MHVSVSVCCSRDTEGQVHIHGVFCVVEVYSSESISHQLLLLETQHSTACLLPLWLPFQTTNIWWLYSWQRERHTLQCRRHRLCHRPIMITWSTVSLSTALGRTCWERSKGMRNNYHKHRTNKLWVYLQNYTYATQFATMLRRARQTAPVGVSRRVCKASKRAG